MCSEDEAMSRKAKRASPAGGRKVTLICPRRREREGV